MHTVTSIAYFEKHTLFVVFLPPPRRKGFNSKFSG